MAAMRRPVRLDWGMTAFGKGFGCRRDTSNRPGVGAPASESLRRTNPRDGGEQLAVYGDLVMLRRLQRMVLRRLGRPRGAADSASDPAGVAEDLIED